MESLEFILLRKSWSRLVGEVKQQDMITMLECALAAPDHKRMRRTQYLICWPHNRDQLAELAVEAAEEGPVSAARLQGMVKKLSFAPVLVIVSVNCSEQNLVPRDELILSAGAGIQNLLIAAEAMGYSSVWKSGGWVRSSAVREKLGISKDSVVVGVIGIGSREGVRPNAESLNRPQFAQQVDSFRLSGH